MALYVAALVEQGLACLLHAQADSLEFIKLTIHLLQAITASALVVFLVAQQAGNLVRLLLVQQQFDAFLAAGLITGADGFGQPVELGLLFPGQLSLFLFQFGQSLAGLAGLLFQIALFTGQATDAKLGFAQIRLN